MKYGTLEYDERGRVLIWTDRLGDDEYGAAEIVARDVPTWFGKLMDGTVFERVEAEAQTAS